METTLLIITFALVVAIGYLIYLNFKPKKEESDQKIIYEYFEALRKEMRETSNDNRKETQGLLEKMNDRLNQGIKHSAETAQNQFTQSTKMIKEVTEELTSLKSTNKQVLNFSEKMQSLENILKNPKQRGILGEYFLEALLNNVFQPNQYKLQYKFKNGEIVDAAIFFNDKIIPIDAKFSLENYNKIQESKDSSRREVLEKEFKMDIKKRIDETSKYIREEENTTDFAFMFIPAEGIYYNLLAFKVGTADVSSQDLVEYAFKKHVIIVSPSSFFAYLQTVMQGLKGLKMEENVKKIIQKVGELSKHMNSYETYMQKLGGNLGTTVNMYNSAYKEFNKMDKDIYKITDGEAGKTVEPLILEKPHLD